MDNNSQQFNVDSEPNLRSKPESSHKAGTIAAIAFIIILAMVGLYLYGALVAKEQVRPNLNNPEPFLETDVSDDLESLESDFENFDVESLDTTDSQIEADLDTSL